MKRRPIWTGDFLGANVTLWADDSFVCSEHQARRMGPPLAAFCQHVRLLRGRTAAIAAETGLDRSRLTLTLIRGTQGKHGKHTR